MVRFGSRSSWVVALALASSLLARTAGAPPPVSDFPAALEPDSGEAPANTRIWAFGADAPPVTEVGFALTVRGASVAVELEKLGCCVIVARRIGTSTGAASALVTAPGGTVSADFTIGTAIDSAVPSLMQADLLGDAGGTLRIAVSGRDDVALAGFLARVGGRIESGAPADRVVDVVAGADGCASITAVDLAGNESAPRMVCGRPPGGGSDGGIADGGGGEGDGGCTTSGGTASGLVVLGLAAWLRALLPSRRRR